MLKISCRGFVNLCKRHTLYFFLCLFSLACVFVSFLFLQSKGYFNYVESTKEKHINQLFCFSCDDGSVAQDVYAKLKNDAFLPALQVITLSDGKRSGIYWNRKLNNDVWYTPYGRFFSMSEMTTGENKVLIGTSYLYRLSIEQREAVWDKPITLDGKCYELVGSYYDNFTKEMSIETLQSNAMLSPFTVPLENFLKNKWQANHSRYIFADSLTEEQIKYLKTYMESFNGVYNLTFPVLEGKKAIIEYASTVSSSTFVILLSFTCLGTVIFSWIKKDEARYLSYSICGASKRQLIFILLFNVFLLLSLAFILAYLITGIFILLMPREMIMPLPWFLAVASYLILITFSLFVVFLKAYRFIFKGKYQNV